jgi:hypothetical protein
MARLTTTSLGLHIRGEIDVTPDAAGGSVPDRLLALVREAGTELWHACDWRFRRKKGTLTTVANVVSAALPADYSELDQRWLMSVAAGVEIDLRFTSDICEFQEHADLCSAAGRPRLATIVQDTSKATFTWYALLSPTPDRIYTPSFWYVVNDPWTVEAVGWTDGSSPMWPATFDAGWRLNALWKVHQAFGFDDRWEDTRRMFNEWLDRQKAENNEMIATGDDIIQDGYGDKRALTEDYY